VKLVQLVGFMKKKFVTMHGHMNVKISYGYVYLPPAVTFRNYAFCPVACPCSL